MGDFDDINVKINVDASGAEQGLTRVSTSLNKLNSDVGKLGTGADFGDKLNSEAKQAEGGLDKLGEAAEQANQKLAKIGSGLNLSAVGSQLDALSGKMQSWGAGLSILAAPFELVGAASVNAFADFEAGMGKIFTLLPDITEKGMSEMSAQIKEFSTTFGADLSTVQQAAYDALSSGVSQADLMPFLETAQAAAVAGMSNVGTAVDGLTSAINAYQMGLDDAGRVSDVFFKTVELGKIEFDELSRNIGKVAPTAAQFGISIEDTGAAIAAITSQGVSAEETMTGLKNLFKDVATPGTQLNKIFQEIAGTTFKDFIANGGTLAEAVSKLRDYSQQTGKSFFEMGSTFESANSLAMLGGGFFEKYAEMTEKIGSAAGSTESAYGKMSDTMAFAIGKLKSQFQVMSVDIGEKLAPVVLEFTQWLTENADKISNFAQNVASAAVPAIESIFDTLQRGMDMYENMSPETKSMLAKLIGVGAVGAAVAGPGLLIGGTALSPVASLITMMGNLQTSSLLAKTAMSGVGTEAGIIAGSSGAAATGLGGISTALAGIGPLGWAAAAALAAAGAAYVTNFGGFRDNINDAVKEAESAIKNFNTGNYEDAGRDAAEAMAKGIGAFGELAIDAVNATPEALQAGSDFVEAFQDGVNQSAESFGSESAKLLLSAMESGLQTNASVLSGVGAVILESIQKGITIDTIGSYLISELSNINVESAGDAIAQSLISGFTHVNFGLMGDVVENAIKGGAKGAIDWIQEETSALTGETKQDVQEAASKIPLIGGIIGGDYEAKETTPTKIDTSTREYRGLSDGLERSVTPLIKEAVSTGIKDGVPSIEDWLKSMGKQGADPSRYQSSYEKEFGLAVKATEAETEAKEKGTKALTNYTGSLEEATRASIEANESKFTLGGKTYAIDLQTGQAESQDFADIIARNQADALAKEAEKQSKELEAARVAAGKQTKAISDKLEDYIESYTSAISKLKPGETNTEALKKLKSSIEELNSDYNVKIPTDITGARNALKTYTNANTETAKALDTNSKTVDSFGNSIKPATENILSFSDPVKTATDNVSNFAPAVYSATDALSQVPGAIDKLLNIDSSALDSLAERRVSETGGAATADEFKKSITEYLTETAYQSVRTSLGQGFGSSDYAMQDSLKGDLLAQLLEYDRRVDFASSGWARRGQAEEYLSSLNAGEQSRYSQIVEDLVNKLYSEKFVERVQSGDIKAVGEAGEGSIARRYDIVGTSIEQSGDKAAITTRTIDTLNLGLDDLGFKTIQTKDGIALISNTLSELTDTIASSVFAIEDASSSWKLATTSKYDTMAESTPIDFSERLGLDSAGNAFNEVGKSTELVSAQTDVLSSKYGLMASTGNNLASMMDVLNNAMDSVVNGAVAKTQSLIAAASSIATATMASATVDHQTGGSSSRQYSNSYGLFTGGVSPGWRDPTPCGWGVAFESGGPVTSTGPAMVHQGEMILSRDDVRNMSKQRRGNEVKLTVDMRNSRFGNADLATDLPRKIAQATKRVLTAGGL